MKKTFRLGALASLMLAAALSTSSVQAAADSPASRKAAAEQLVKLMDDLTGPKRMMASMREMVRAPMDQALAQNPRLTPAQRQRASDVLSQAMSDVMSEVMDQLIPGVYAAMTQMYVDRFTLAEIEQLQAFYASPVVRKATLLSIEELPRLLQPMFQSMQQMQPKIQQRMEAASAQLKTEGIDLSQPQPQQGQ